MTTLDDLFDRILLRQMVAGGYVRVRQHPSLPLNLFNYSEKAQYERVWNPVTRACRGLIVDAATDRVVARPFQKFFNHGEPESAALDLTGRVVVTDKADGSLGITYPTPGGLSIATRGSFTSDQAVHATMLLRDRYAGWEPLAGCTALFEIVYPANRIVVDYGAMDDLILLGYVHIATGRSIGPEQGWGWPGPVIATFEYETFADALAAAPRPGKEGLVVHLLDSDQRVKLKQADYVRLHRIVTGLNARTVWEHLRDGGSVVGLIEPLPDEFHQWVKDVANDLRMKAQNILFAADAIHRGILRDLPAGWGRKDYALRAKDHECRALLFKMLDGADVLPVIWRQIDPGPDWRPTTYTEDAA